MPVHNANAGGATGWCLEVHDLAAFKLVAGRERDIEFVRVLVQEAMVDPAVLGERLAALPLPEGHLGPLRDRLIRAQATSG